MAKRITIRKIAEQAGVSPGTVDRILPKCWKVTSARITDSAGQDRKLDPAAKYTMEFNSIILLEIEKR